MVIKKDGTRQEFDRNKILQGIITACEKRPVPLGRLEELVSEIEQPLRNSMEQEVSSQAIGEMVMEGLREIDEVAYVRFASVYRQFKDINGFLEELDASPAADEKAPAPAAPTEGFLSIKEECRRCAKRPAQIGSQTSRPSS